MQEPPQKEAMQNEVIQLKDQLIDAIFRLKHLFTTLHAEAGAKHGGYDVSIAELELLRVIRENKIEAENNACIADIQHHLHISKAGVSKMLGVLEEKGYLNRDVDKNNRRNLIITITDKGRDVADTLTKDTDESLAKIIRQLGADETEQFVQYVNKFVEAME